MQYNKHMGGVDKANSLLGLYRSPSRSKTWYFPIFTWVLDMSVINAWLLYRKDCNTARVTSKPLKEFRMELAKSLANAGKSSRGRPSISLTNKIPAKVISNPILPRPDIITQKDGIGHWPTYDTKVNDCKER
ncbi:unnamed protein product [Acanthoscelides obtectus]|uniref:PiggyBac transposable element-derived protein domain-containing protein n=1 Tax=Acanthoscelides obtectus TaxID=200917 RepID=A0A9P0JYR1_ACAOB|nr:unnamed protein product [Acanthoscelides obtectus]CAK1663937.1 PiggyBac transposable element-derived protein 2 [Acanthoscelides obtectus]